jgi:hypothetical protein
MWGMEMRRRDREEEATNKRGEEDNRSQYHEDTGERKRAKTGQKENRDRKEGKIQKGRNRGD